MSRRLKNARTGINVLEPQDASQNQSQNQPGFVWCCFSCQTSEIIVNNSIYRPIPLSSKSLGNSFNFWPSPGNQQTSTSLSLISWLGLWMRQRSARCAKATAREDGRKQPFQGYQQIKGWMPLVILRVDLDARSSPISVYQTRDTRNLIKKQV